MDEPDQIDAEVRVPGQLSPSVVEQEVAFAAFYRESAPRLIGFLVLQGARPADAAEITQEVMIKLWRSWSVVTKPMAWARVTASRALARRMAAIEEDLIAEFGERSAVLAADSGIDEWIENNHYYRLLRALPPRQRQVMVWTMEGYSSVEIAELLRLNPATVRSNLRKARRALATELDGGAR
ncbi:RNA polymerase sigma factor [Nocardia sp. XZ_19_369]|uniref:RNA polymerase sigma factor n=1 Tax=Nocardia sp. XZ_19_369 TaxID=2769487 RepID=UPI0018906171|nr:sigma-70 family RNA polymerase sigma factor [Nocardia sp. XZ_19_369]